MSASNIGRMGARMAVLLEKNIKVKDPLCLFREWFDLAVSSKEVEDAGVSCLTTVNNGAPLSRYMEIKYLTDKGPVFFTHYESPKSLDIVKNPNVAISFYWEYMRRAVTIEGKAERISCEENVAGFYKLSRKSQIGVIASEQSAIIECYELLEQQKKSLIESMDENEVVPMPNWGGYLVKPTMVEFFQGHPEKLADRIRFHKDPGVYSKVDGKLVHKGENGWVYFRLEP